MINFRKDWRPALPAQKNMSIQIYNAAHLTDGQIGPTAVAIGNFDGVHQGHRVICRSLVAKARELGVPPVIYTFRPHPRKILSGPNSVRLLTNFEKKCELLAGLGVGVVAWSEFTREFSEQSPATFVRSMLVDRLQVRHIFVGYDSHFAHNRKGNFDTLVALGHEHGFGVDLTEAVSVKGVAISSSNIRRCIEDGEIPQANRLLGWQYAVAGTVIRGEARGRAIGFPTANLETAAEVIPAEGVYITRTRVGEHVHPSVTNVGRNPTFNPETDDVALRVETHLLDFSGDLYGLHLEVVFLERIRAEKRFPNPAALRTQIGMDVEAARRFLAHRGEG